MFDLIGLAPGHGWLFVTFAGLTGLAAGFACIALLRRERRRESSFRFLFENNPLPMWVWDHETLRFLAVNNAAVEKYGHSREHFLTLTVRDIKLSTNWDSINAIVRGDESSLSEGRISQHARADGSSLDVELYGRSLEYQGRAASLVASIDITERQHAEYELRQAREFLTTIVESVPLTIVVKNADDLTYALVNRAAEEQYGTSRDKVIGKTSYDVFPKEAADQITARDKELIAANRETFFEVRLQDTAKGKRFLTSRRVPIRNEQGEPRYILSVIEDVTERERAADKLRQTRGFLDTIVDNMPAMLTVKDARDQRYLLVNRATEEFFGLSRSEMVGKTGREIFSAPAANYVDAIDQDVAQSGALRVIEAHPVETPRNGTRMLTTKKVVMRGEDGEAQYLLSLSEDVTDRKRAEDRIAHMARHDSLTDLPNRAAFNDRLATAFEQAAAANDMFAVLCVDLDRFKEVNDVFGHAAGDALLCEVARRLNEAADGAFIARLGGDEFTLIVSKGAQPATAKATADRLQRSFAADIAIGAQQLRIGLSIGVAVYPSDGKTATVLLANADAALFRAKGGGRGAIRFFEAHMDESLRERRAMLHELRSATEHGQLALHYQPQARIGGEIIGFEALARWHHPTRGTIPPGTFIPLAEESGLIVTMGEWILREACREAASWPRPLQIAINLSPVQFRHGDLPALVHTVLLETGLAAHRLELEVTEGALIGDFARAVSILRRLKALGVRIAMDDFGTGYSSLSYLQSFPFDKIKIDRTFIQNLEHNQHSAAIVRAVIGLGRSLHLPVMAEGVETAEQLAFLAGESCDEVQGFYVGRPAPIDTYAEMVGRPAAPKLKAMAG